MFVVDVRTVDRSPASKAYYNMDFSDVPTDWQPDIIMWASSLEHNSREDMRKYYKESMKRLKRGGMFIATFAIGEKTCWDESAEQTILSVEDAQVLFDDHRLRGNFRKIKKKYRDNAWNLAENYRRRFEKWEDTDPHYIVGAVRKVKK